MKYYVSILSFSLLLLLMLGSCKQKENKIEEVGCEFNDHKISFDKDGPYTIGESVTFSHDVPDCNETLWMLYIAGTPSNAVTYYQGRSFSRRFTERTDITVWLIINGDTANKEKKNLYATQRVIDPIDPNEIKPIAGMWHWNVVEDSTWSYFQKIDTLRTYKDTFEIKVVDYRTLEVKGRTLKLYEGHDSVGITNSYIFTERGLPEYSWATLQYFYKNDSVFFSTHAPQGGLPGGGKRASVAFGITKKYSSKR